MEDYRVELPAYSGPMDLLLFLIRKSELDIYDIPVSSILDQYLAYMEILKALDIDEVADFMVIASRLMEIKSRMLLPRETLDDSEQMDLVDPRAELVKELLEYKRFRDRARGLEVLEELQAESLPRGVAPEDAAIGAEFAEEGEFLEAVTIWDLVTAFSRISKEVLSDLPRKILDTDTPISKYMDMIMEQVENSQGRQISFGSLFTAATDRIELVGLFLGLLELVRQRRVRALPSNVPGEFTIVWRDAAESLTLQVVEKTHAEPEPVPPKKTRPAFLERPAAEDKVAPPAEAGLAKQASFLTGIDPEILEKIRRDTAKLVEFEKAIDDISALDTAEQQEENEPDAAGEGGRETLGGTDG
jgi:segregation and condensation protein A